MTPDEIEAIRERVEAATPGPWEVGLGWIYTMPVYADDNRLSDVLGMTYSDADRAVAERERAQRNAEFIAAARSDVPALLAALAEAQRERDELKAALWELAPSSLVQVVRDWLRVREAADVPKLTVEHYLDRIAAAMRAIESQEEADGTS